VYLQPFYKNKGFKRGYCKNAESYFHEAISLPMYVEMTQAQQEKICEQIRLVVEKVVSHA
jgi:dTDP-4-amino-4,6-dideoxygalactose transaminase